MASAAAINRISEIISNTLQPLESADRQQVLWQQLQASLIGDSQAISRMLDEFRLLLESERKRLEQALAKKEAKSKTQKRHKSPR
jgi:hypothetical protein